MFRLRFLSLIACCALVGQSAAADPAASTNGTQGAPLKSVLVRRSAAGAADSAAEQAASPKRIVDPNVKQASANDPFGSVAAADSNKTSSDAADVASAAASLAATDLLNHSLEAPKNSPLRGHTLTLLAAITPFGSSRTSQLYIARAYWKLSAALGDYNWAVEEADALNHLAEGTAAMDATVLATARASTQARLLEAKLSAVTAQQELADLLGIPANNPLPLASDPPLVGAYRTYFETLYATRVPPPRMRLIDRTLPIRREAIETHVAAVQAAASAVHAAEEARTKGQSDLQNLLQCEADLSRQRRSFLKAVRDYNLDIDEYALTVAEPTVPTDRVIGMLIRMKPATPPTTSVVAPPAADSTHPPAIDPLLQPATPPASKPSPAAGSGSTGSPTIITPTTPTSPKAAPTGSGGASSSTDPRAPTNPATVDNPFAVPATPGGTIVPATPAK